MQPGTEEEEEEEEEQKKQAGSNRRIVGLGFDDAPTHLSLCTTSFFPLSIESNHTKGPFLGPKKTENSRHL